MKITDIVTESSKLQRAMLSESGSVEGTGPIAREEIMPTIEAIEKDLGIKLSDVTLGSAAMNKAGTLGKKQFSGDIDAAVNIAKEDRESFEQKLKDSPLILDYRMGNTVSTKVKIIGYDANRTDKEGKTPEGRTGYVQFDFMPGNPAAKKAFYHSPEEGTSSYKGAYRTELLIITAAVWDQNNSEETTPDGRPLESERWVFSPDHALVRVLRKPKMGAKGYTKAHTQEVIGEPITDPDDIARTLGLGSGDDLDSFESLWNAIKTHYDPAHVELIRDIAMKNHVIGKQPPQELLEVLPAVGAIIGGIATGARLAAPYIARGVGALAKKGKDIAKKVTPSKDTAKGIAIGTALGGGDDDASRPYRPSIIDKYREQEGLTDPRDPKAVIRRQF